MKKIDGIRYYKAKEIQDITGIAYQKLYNCMQFSDELEERGEERLLPKPKLIGERCRYYAEHQLEEIKEIINGLKRGDMAGYSKRKNTTYNKIQEENNKLKKEIKRLKKEIKINEQI